MKKSVVFFLTLSIFILKAHSAQATWIPLSDLTSLSNLQDNSLTAGDKLFSEFEMTGIAQGGAPAPTADSVFIQGGRDSETGDYGIRFRLDWTAGLDQIINANINFKISILPSYDDSFIKDAILSLGIAGAAGTGIINTTEIICDAPFLGNSLAALDTSKEEGDGSAYLIDHSEFELFGNPVQVKEIWAYTGIIISGGANGTAKLDDIYMLYSQVPEPATVILLGLSSLALLKMRKR